MVRHSTVAYVIVATCAKFVYYSHGRSGESQRLMEKGDPVPSLTHKDCLLIRFSSSPFRNAQAMTSVFYNNGVKAPGGREDKKEKRKKKKLMKWDTTVVGEWQKQLRVFFIYLAKSFLPPMFWLGFGESNWLHLFCINNHTADSWMVCGRRVPPPFCLSTSNFCWLKKKLKKLPDNLIGLQ